MKTLKITGIVLLVLIVLFFGIAFLLPSEVEVERSLVIPATSEVVFEQVNNLHNWQNWSPWHQMDPNMQITYEGPLQGEGASYSWKSEKVGNGKLIIISSLPNEYIATSMDFMEQGKANAYYRFQPAEEGTQVTWTFETDMGNGPIAKYFGLMMDNMVGSDFEKGLNNLKTYVQKTPAEKITTNKTASDMSN